MSNLNDKDIDLNKVYEFTATITYPIYYSNVTNYGVYEFTCDQNLPFTNTFKSKDKDVYLGCLNGNMQELYCDNQYAVKAKLKYNGKYHKYDYCVESILSERPKSINEQKIFLESLCSQRQANALIEKYPNIIEDIMNGQEIDINCIKGIGLKTFNSIKEKVLDNYIIQDILILLKPLGITFNTIKKIVGDESNPSLLKQKIIDNPYILTSVHGLGFKKVDDLALKLNPNLRVSEFRVKAYLSYKLKEIANSQGHTWLRKKDVIGYVRKDIRECIEIYNDFLNKEIKKPTLLHIDTGNEKIGLLYFYNIAKNIKERLEYLDGLESIIEPFTDEEIQDSIQETEKELGFSLTDEQKDAIKSVNKHNVIIITAPAGSGKSISIRGITNLLSKAKIKDSMKNSIYNQLPEELQEKSDEFDIAPNNDDETFLGISIYDSSKGLIGQCALSAKASKRMKEVSNLDASTMHRMLGYDGDGFAYNQSTPLPYHVNIFDEVSMVNKTLINSYINAIKPHSKIIFIFDYAQLPPIGSGDFTRDILYSSFCINKFTKVHRQGQDSGILMDANYIRVGKNPIIKLEKNIVHGVNKDMFYRFENDKERIRDLAIKCYLKSVKEVGLDEAVLITPRKAKCTNSALEFNKIIQDELLPNEKIKMTRWKDGQECYFKLGAKIIQKKNDYNKKVFNGDEGYIASIDERNKQFTINFNLESGIQEVTYNYSELEQIELGYAMSIHAVQGSQYHSVICAFDGSSYKMLNRKILYTAITRAKEKCLLISEPKVFLACLNDINNTPRQTYLKDMFSKH